MRIGFQSEYANLSVCRETSCFVEFKNKKQDETDRGTFPEDGFIQNGSWWSVSSEKNVRISYAYETHEEELISVDHCLFDFTAGKLRSFMLKILKVLRFDTNHLLNNTFWTSHYSHMIFTGPWNLHNVARPHLKSESSVFTLRPQFASLQRIVVLSARKFDLSLLRLWYPLSSKKIIL